MMGNYDFGFGFGFLFLGLHCLFAGVAFFGSIAALIWLAKHAPKDTVKKVALWTIIIGIAGLILTAPFSFGGRFGRFGGSNYESDRNGFFDEMAREMREYMGWDYDYNANPPTNTAPKATKTLPTN